MRKRPEGRAPSFTVNATSPPNDERTLIDQLLDEQRNLSAAVRFARQHEAHEIPAQAKYYRDLIPLTLPKKGQQYAFEVDLDKCSGCKACVTACHSLNGLDENETWRGVGLLISSAHEKVGRWESGKASNATSPSPAHFPTFSPASYQQHVTTACHHCVDPACLNGCPVLAYEKDSVTGIVHHLDDQCIGCSYCVMKCPYEVPQYHKKKGIVRKCDMCSSRLLTNEAPACVQACPNEAIRITLVGQEQVSIETTSHSQLVPGAPASTYTIPTTRYLSARGFPTNTQPADFAQLKPAPSHPPLVFMLVLTQLSVGMLCLAWLRDLFLPPATAEFEKNYYSTALLSGVLGLGASVLHLGRPLQAWRAFLGWRKSWLSREIIFFGMFIHLAAYQTASFWIPIFAPGAWLKSAVAISGLIGVFCSVMVYVDTRRVCWNFRQSGGKFFGSTILLGFAANVALSFVLRTGVPHLFIAGLILVSAAKLFWEAKFIFQRVADVAAGVLPAVERRRLARRIAIKIFSDANTSDDQSGRRDASPLRQAGCPPLPLKLSALLQRSVLLRATVMRFVCGAFGGIVLPAALLFSAQLNPAFLYAIAGTSFALCLLGELLERNLFFTAMVAPKMPGGVSP